LFEEKPLGFLRFQDSQGNFEIYYPRGWDFDHDIAVEDSRYTISFNSKDRQSTFTIAVDANLPPGFRFPKYAKAELESPESGIYTAMRKARFHNMPAFSRDYVYASGGKRFHGGGVMFCAGDAVFSLTWSAPESDDEQMEKVFKHMREEFVVKRGLARR
jgi:hypothetical protein